MSFLLPTLGVSLLSALVPFVNVELYLGYLATQVGAGEQWLVATVAAFGQTVGKLAWYYAAHRSMETRWMRRKLEKPRTAESYARWQARAQGRPVFMGLVNFSAASVGLPPLLVMAVVSGSLRMPLWVFVPTTFVGRLLRFWVILAGVDLAFT